MAFRDDPKGWARGHADRIRSDPKGWSREQAQRVRQLVDVAPFSDDALERELASLRERAGKLSELGADERQQLREELAQLHERLGASRTGATGAKAGLAAAALPVFGLISGPVAGSAYGVYRSKRLRAVRSEIEEMMRQVEKAGTR